VTSLAIFAVALEHRWNPKGLLLLFTAYFDETDTHGPAPTIIMGAFLGTARQWQIFGRRLRVIQREYEFKIFHATDFKARSGEFSGWPIPKCIALLETLVTLVRDELTEGIVVHLEHERFVNEYRSPPIPKKMNLDSQYGVCFRACMAHLLHILSRDGKRHRLHVPIAIMAAYCTVVGAVYLGMAPMAYRAFATRSGDQPSRKAGPPTPDYMAWLHVEHLTLEQAARLWCDFDPNYMPLGPAAARVTTWRTVLKDAVKRWELHLAPDSDETDRKYPSDDTWTTRTALRDYARKKGFDPQFLRDMPL
jgi:hypothetical protein